MSPTMAEPLLQLSDHVPGRVVAADAVTVMVLSVTPRTTSG
jgi:hypothetical protein